MRFSVIVTAHNAEKRFLKCLESVKSQVFKDYELIIVCDNCSDNTAEIARNYTGKVIEINEANVGKARNAGLDNATGEYVLFLDDDDWWLHEYVLTLIDRKLNNEDILCFSFIWKGVMYAKPMDNYGGKEHFVAVWNKCWKRCFIGKTRFSSRVPGEDVDFHWAMWAKNPKYTDWDMPMYYYNYMREGSITWQNT